MSLNKYYSAAFIAFFIWGFFSFALKPLHNFASLDILFYRVFFSVIIMVLVNLFFRQNIIRSNWTNFKNCDSKKKKSIVVLTLGGGVFLTLNWFVFIYVVNHVSVNAASLAYLICPILTTVFAYLILSEKLSKWQWGAVLMSVFACVLLSLDHFGDFFYSLIVAATYALYLVSQRKNSEMDKFLTLTIQLVFTAIVLIPFYPKYSGAVPTQPLFYGFMLIIVVLFTIIPLFLSLYALKGINSSAVGIMIYINPIINFVLAIFYYNEQISSLQYVSYFLILIAIVVFNYKALHSTKSNVIPPEIEGSN
ncbi:chloramphenicol-sensitive protein RarD [Flavobacterium micromati]|uniref:Chloramphenicol-sensitive protein RarD n=1 Tax=Flavobacterium micromati TaxID=229205 RepID=A0A1M5IJX9_9FLAO|nr:EamA family transporter [Flavobacterium micromati]SHG28648.1 chloramphenicol-sensitive protein RarD [Flavobacterium micromati]